MLSNITGGAYHCQKLVAERVDGSLNHELGLADVVAQAVHTYNAQRRTAYSPEVLYAGRCVFQR